MHRSAIVIAAIVALAACVSGPPPLPPPPTAPPEFDHLIVPGKRIGPVSIGMTSKQLLDAAGTPTQTFRFANASGNDFAGGISAIVDDATLQVSSTSTADSSYATAEGVRTGLTDLEVRSRLGNPQSVISLEGIGPELCYPGMAIYFSRGKVSHISLFNPGGACL